VPQFAESVELFTHDPLHSVSLAGHAHEPAVQT
jgi:hypothetical protein